MAERIIERRFKARRELCYDAFVETLVRCEHKIRHADQGSGLVRFTTRARWQSWPQDVSALFTHADGWTNVVLTVRVSPLGRALAFLLGDFAGQNTPTAALLDSFEERLGLSGSFA